MPAVQNGGTSCAPLLGLGFGGKDFSEEGKDFGDAEGFLQKGGFAARGPRQLWVVPGAYHTAALGFYPEEFQRRVLAFFGTYANAPASPAAPSSAGKRGAKS